MLKFGFVVLAAMFIVPLNQVLGGPIILPRAGILGVIDTVEEKSSDHGVFQSINFKTFESLQHVAFIEYAKIGQREGRIYNLTAYEAYVKDYVDNCYKLSSPFSFDEGWVIVDKVENSGFSEAPKSGDILFSGSLFGVYSPYGHFKQLINGINLVAPHAFTYKDDVIELSSGEASCVPDNFTGCDAQVDIRFNEESFSLSPGEFYEPSEGPIKRLTILRSNKAAYVNGGINWHSGLMRIDFHSVEEPDVAACPEGLEPPEFNFWEWFKSFF